MVQLPSEFRPALETYRGPLDLLLYLIKRDEVDVFDIPISRIVEQYQIYLEVLTQVDPNACGEFLVMAANLMEIKSKLLLPREELAPEEDLEDPRIELVRQLLEYKKFKERAMLLEKRVEERRRRHERPRIELDDIDLQAAGPIELGNVNIWDLFTAFHRIQLSLGGRDPHRVIVEERPIEEYIAALEEILTIRPGRTAVFDELFSEVRSRQEAIGFFLAVLELAKERRLSFHQEELFGPIEVRLHSAEEVERLLQAARQEGAAAADPAEKFLLEGERPGAFSPDGSPDPQDDPPGKPGP